MVLLPFLLYCRDERHMRASTTNYENILKITISHTYIGRISHRKTPFSQPNSTNGTHHNPWKYPVKPEQPIETDRTGDRSRGSAGFGWTTEFCPPLGRRSSKWWELEFEIFSKFSNKLRMPLHGSLLLQLIQSKVGLNYKCYSMNNSTWANLW